jgi:O-acetylhomoserine (thiol)-lyase
VSSNKLYGGTYTQFNDILPTLGITVTFVDAEDPENFRGRGVHSSRFQLCFSTFQ